MPSYATCHIFAATVQRVTSDAVAHIIDSAPSAYRWGAQGVSPLRMYHAPLPSPLHHAAVELRTQPPARLFEALCRAAARVCIRLLHELCAQPRDEPLY